MDIIDVWRDVTSRISFHTKETSNAIPEASGIYGWFIPLWIYSSDLNSFLKLIHSIYLYDPISKGEPARSVSVPFNWDAMHVQLQKHVDLDASETLISKWQEMLGQPEQKEAFARALMEASILLPPLYIGKADNLRERYFRHVNGTSQDENNFHNRFSTYAKYINLQLRISDLLFVCIKIDAKTSQVLRESQLNVLLEQVVMRLAKPPYSIR